ncbi:hypothetical protein ABQD61_07010 [Enterococcus asini]|uniref:hypothetical protein n=1 Tax=Enterococcus asini TaxID=57732 RepID=UPI0032E419C7
MDNNQKAIEELRNDVRRLKTLIENHIGDGGKAHTLAQPGLPGFAEYDAQNASVGYRKRLDTNLDMLTLPVGKWEIVTDVNSPDSSLSFWEVDVTEAIEDPKRRQIIAVKSGTREMYFRNWHTGGNISDAPNDWTWIPQEYVLWNGSEGGLNAVLQLKHRSGMFKNYRIEYECVNNKYSPTFPTAGTVFRISGTNIPDSSAEGMGIYECELTYSNTNNSHQFKITHIGRRWNGVVTPEPTNPIVIKRIIGIK